jgi:hypothetical protein
MVDSLIPKEQKKRGPSIHSTFASETIQEEANR